MKWITVDNVYNVFNRSISVICLGIMASSVQRAIIRISCCLNSFIYCYMKTKMKMNMILHLSLVLSLFFASSFSLSFSFQIQSGSELLLTTSGSFKHFDSIDRDYKPDEQPSDQSSTFWNITVPELPPQPLRPAPKSPTLFERAKSMDKSPKKYTNVPMYVLE